MSLLLFLLLHLLLPLLLPKTDSPDWLDRQETTATAPLRLEVPRQGGRKGGRKRQKQKQEQELQQQG